MAAAYQKPRCERNNSSRPLTAEDGDSNTAELWLESALPRSCAGKTGIGRVRCWHRHEQVQHLLHVPKTFPRVDLQAVSQKMVPVRVDYWDLDGACG